MASSVEERGEDVSNLFLWIASLSFLKISVPRRRSPPFLRLGYIFEILRGDCKDIRAI